jgi:hypothetical protein
MDGTCRGHPSSPQTPVGKSKHPTPARHATASSEGIAQRERHSPFSYLLMVAHSVQRAQPRSSGETIVFHTRPSMCACGSSGTLLSLGAATSPLVSTSHRQAGDDGPALYQLANQLHRAPTDQSRHQRFSATVPTHYVTTPRVTYTPGFQSLARPGRTWQDLSQSDHVDVIGCLGVQHLALAWAEGKNRRRLPEISQSNHAFATRAAVRFHTVP